MNGKIKIFLVIAVWFVGIACGGGAQTAHQKDRGAALKAAPAKPAQVSRPLKPAAAPAAIDCPPEPGWVVGKAHPRYPSGRFLTGVGISGESAEHARDVALKNLAKNIKVDIDSLSKDFISTEGVYAESAIQTRVDAILEGVERKDGYFDKCRGQYYALVVMDRRLEAEKHRQQLKETENRLKNYMDAARQAEQSGNVVRALHQYLSGYEESLALDPQINVLRVISKSRVAVSPELEGLRAKAFESKIHSLVQNVKFAVAAGDGQKIKSMQIPGQPLAVKVYLANGSQQVPVRGLPLTFKYEQGSGTLQADSETNGSGIARAGVRRIDSYNEDQHAIVARIDTPQIHGELNNELSERFLTPLDAKNARFFYSIEKISGMSTQSSAWQSGLVRLVENLIRNIDPNKTPVVGVIRFTDMRGNQMTAFSKILAEDFKNLLAKSDSLKVREISVDPEEEVNPPKIAKQSHLDMYIDGSFHLQNDGLQIIAKLIHVKTNDYMGTSDTLIEKSALRPEDLAKLEGRQEVIFQNNSWESPEEKNQDEFRQELDKLYYARPNQSPFNLKVWADRENYEIGDKVVFYVKSDRDCYLTLINAGSSGNVTVIFPNAYHKDNFIRAGVTYAIPGPEYGFDFDIQGPPGQERVKAIATLTPDTPINLDLSKGFHVISPQNQAGTRDIGVMANKFKKNSSAVWAEAHEEIFIFHKDQVYTRGTRKIPIVERPKKPIDMIGTFGNEQDSMNNMQMRGGKKIPITEKPKKPIDMIGTFGNEEEQGSE